jgi:hypothetical protein
LLQNRGGSSKTAFLHHLRVLRYVFIFPYSSITHSHLGENSLICAPTLPSQSAGQFQPGFDSSLEKMTTVSSPLLIAPKQERSPPSRKGNSSRADPSLICFTTKSAFIGAENMPNIPYLQPIEIKIEFISLLQMDRCIYRLVLFLDIRNRAMVSEDLSEAAPLPRARLQ